MAVASANNAVPKYTVLITVLEGRNFLKKPLSKVYIQSRFSSEILTTDPVEQTLSPLFDTELAWEIDSKSLHYVRSQRVPIKLSCYSIDHFNRRELVGYTMLDLRAAASELPAQDKWLTLVNTKKSPGTAFRPEIRVAFAAVTSEALAAYNEPPLAPIAQPNRNKVPPKSVVQEATNSDHVPLDTPQHDESTPVISTGDTQHNPSTANGNALPQEVLVPYWHQFRFSIDLRSIRDFQVTSTVYCRYAYAPFGTVSPVLTHPPVEITKTVGLASVNSSPSRNNTTTEESTHAQTETMLPHGFCAFEFVMSPDTLANYLDGVPLIVDIISRDKYDKDTVIGQSYIDMSKVLQAKPQQEAFEGQKKATVKAWNGWVVIEDTREDRIGKRLGEIRTVLALEDFGTLEEQGIGSVEDLTKLVDLNDRIDGADGEGSVLADQSGRLSVKQLDSFKVDALNGQQTTFNAKEHTQTTQVQDASISIHATPEYRTALELELWKQNEELLFKEHLRNVEAQLLNTYTQEMEARERARQESLNRRLESLNNVHAQMTKLLQDLETRERKLIRAEEDLERRSQECGRDYESKIAECRDAARRVHEEYKHKLALEKLKLEDLNETVAKSMKERDEWEAKCRVLEVEVGEFRKGVVSSGQNTNLEVQPQSWITEKTYLEQKLDAALKSKRMYKQKLSEAIEENDQLRKDWEQERVTMKEKYDSLLKKKHEGQEKKEQIVVDDGLGVTEEDRLTLEEIKKELEQLRRSQGIGSSRPKSRPTSSRASSSASRHDFRLREITADRDTIQVRQASDNPIDREHEYYSAVPNNFNTDGTKSNPVIKSNTITTATMSTPPLDGDSVLEFVNYAAARAYNDRSEQSNMVMEKEDAFDIIEALKTSEPRPPSSTNTDNAGKPPLPPTERITSHSIRNISSAYSLPQSQPFSDGYNKYQWQDIGVSVVQLGKTSPDKLAEAERMMGERDGLLSTGIYVREDRLIRDLEKRVKELVGV